METWGCTVKDGNRVATVVSGIHGWVSIPSGEKLGLVSPLPFSFVLFIHTLDTGLSAFAAASCRG